MYTHAPYTVPMRIQDGPNTVPIRIQDGPNTVPIRSQYGSKTAHTNTAPIRFQDGQLLALAGSLEVPSLPPPKSLPPSSSP